MIKFKIKKGDTVQVICGDNTGSRGLIKKVLRNKNQVIVEGVNIVTRHIRPNYKNPDGSLKKEMPIHISNVSLIDPDTNKPSKIGYKKDVAGNKVRYFKKSGSEVK